MHRPTVLLVVDADQPRAMLAELLEVHDFIVFHVRGDEAFELLGAAGLVDAVVVDLDGDADQGAGAFRAAMLRRHGPDDVPMLVMASSFADAFDVGADFVVSKPCEPVELATAIRAALRAPGSSMAA